MLRLLTRVDKYLIWAFSALCCLGTAYLCWRYDGNYAVIGIIFPLSMFLPIALIEKIYEKHLYPEMIKREIEKRDRRYAEMGLEADQP
jgi:hypothetical protein